MKLLSIILLLVLTLISVTNAAEPSDLETVQRNIAIAYSNGDFDKAESLCNDAISTYKDVNYLLMLKYYILNATERGAEGAEMLMSYKDERSGYYWNLAADFFMREGDLAKVEEIIAANIQPYKPGCARSMMKSAVVQLQKGETWDAFERARKAFSGNYTKCPYPTEPYFDNKMFYPNLFVLHLSRRVNMINDFLPILWDYPTMTENFISNPYYPLVAAIILNQFNDNQKDAEQAYLKGVLNFPINSLAPPAKKGLFNDSDLQELQKVALRVEAGLKKVPVVCANEQIPTGTFLLRYENNMQKPEIV